MKTFPERKCELIDVDAIGFSSCMKKPIPISAKIITEPFRVQTLEGNYKQGKAGDLLMCGVDNELYICDRDIFDKSYDWV